MKLHYLLISTALLAMATCACGPESDVPLPPDAYVNNDDDTGGNDGKPEEQSGLNLYSELQAINDADGFKMIVCAHRANTFEGKRLEIPENSVPAIQKAIELGIDMVEFDPRATKDGVIVNLHNATINATTNGTGTLATMDSGTLFKYNLKVGSKVTDYKVPTISDCFDAAKGKIFVCLDIKEPALLPEIVRMVQQKGMVNQVCYYTGSSTTYLDDLVRMEKNSLLMPWVSDPSSLPVLTRFYSKLRMVQFNYAAANMTALASAIKQYNLIGYANHLDNDAELLTDKTPTLDGFITNRINIAQSDYGDLIIAKLKERGLRLR